MTALHGNPRLPFHENKKRLRRQYKAAGLVKQVYASHFRFQILDLRHDSRQQHGLPNPGVSIFPPAGMRRDKRQQQSWSNPDVAISTHTKNAGGQLLGTNRRSLGLRRLWLAYPCFGRPIAKPPSTMFEGHGKQQAGVNEGLLNSMVINFTRLV